MAGRQLHRLGALRVAKAVDPGHYADGGGLFMQIAGSGARIVGVSLHARQARNDDVHPTNTLGKTTQAFRAREAYQDPIASYAPSASRDAFAGISRGVRGVAHAPRLGARTGCSAPVGRALSFYRRSPQTRAMRRDPGGQRTRDQRRARTRQGQRRMASRSADGRARRRADCMARRSAARCAARRVRRCSSSARRWSRWGGRWSATTAIRTAAAGRSVSVACAISGRLSCGMERPSMPSSTRRVPPLGCIASW